jgi:phosphopantetheinyl transferase (holo-ACP synthase)
VKLVKIQKKNFLYKYVQTNTENRNLKIKKIKTHHIADLFAIKEGAAQLTGIYDAVTLSA